jgi:tRNA threonylcarbamoyladenosine biosynthesis protein TsaB
MSLILNIETATEICSVSLSESGKTIRLKESKEGQQHARILTVLIDELFSECKIPIQKLQAVAVSMGPGSYTGLRIGVSVAKGIAYAGQLPLIAVNTLQAMTWGILKTSNFDTNTWYCPMIDARRMEVYTAFYDSSNTLQRKVSAEIISQNSFQDILHGRKVVFFGNGSTKCQNTINSPNAYFIEKTDCSAANMSELSFESYQKKDFVDVAYFEPFYLKDFVATVPKNNVLA